MNCSWVVLALALLAGACLYVNEGIEMRNK